MKKQLPFLMCLGLLAYGSASAQTFTVRDLELGVQHADVSAIDIDKDGDLDLLIMGEGDDGARLIQLYINNGTGTFTKTASPFLGGAFATIDWGDVNGDGRLDMVQSGFKSDGPFSALYTSNEAGDFTSKPDLDFAGSAPNIGLADLNNDGFQDIYSFSNANVSRNKIYFNDKQGGFTVSEQFDDFAFIDPQVSVVDFDNDGDLDLFVMAYDETNRTRFSKMFVNTAGVFAVRDLGLKQKGFGSAVWGDYDGDGDLDLLLNGDGGANGEASNDIYRLYKNTNGAFTEATTFSEFRQISVGDGGKFADWDNDGDLDIIVTGYSEALRRQATAIFLNNAGTFTAMANNDKLPGVSESSIEVADIDNDSDLDLLLTGYSGNEFNGAGSNFNRKVSLLVVNPTLMVNLAPTAPTNLRAVAGTNGAITFSWNAATDITTPQMALTYNMFLVEMNTGKHYSFALADTTTGKLKLQRMGNVQLNKSWTLKDLPNGRYRVGVQAIDNSFAGSPFMKISFTNTNGVLTALSEEKAKFSLNVYPNPSQGMVQVQLASGKQYDVHVSTLDGRLVKSMSVTGQAQLDLKAGMYVMQVRAANGDVEIRRIVIQ